MPWMRFAGAEWDHSDPATIRVEIGDWQVVISATISNRCFMRAGKRSSCG
jgi:hypothetical protein